MARSNPAGWNWLLGGAAAAFIIPLLALWLEVPFVIALVAGVLSGGGVVFLLRPSNRLDKLDGAGLSQARIKFARELISRAETDVARINDAARQIKDKHVRSRFEHLAEIGQSILDTIAEEPLKIDRGRRFVTYYMPRATELAEGYVVMEKLRTPNPERRANMGALIERLDNAFTRYADNLHDSDLDRLDIEMKLLKHSLDDEIGPSQASNEAQVEISQHDQYGNDKSQREV